MNVLMMATMLGSSIIEKHFTHNKNLEGNDHYHSMDKDDLKNFIYLINKNLDLIGLKKKFLSKVKIFQEKNARRVLCLLVTYLRV